MKHTAIQKITTFLKKYWLDITVIIVGEVMSLLLSFLTADWSFLAGTVLTFFVESALLAIRQEAKVSFAEMKASLNERAANLDATLETLNGFFDAKIKIDDFKRKFNSKDDQEAVRVELTRFKTAIEELMKGKRRVYSKELVYSEQKKVIMSAGTSINTFHIVREIDDLIRWDPEKMNKETSFYKYLYSVYQDPSRANLAKKRIIVMPDDLFKVIELHKRGVASNSDSHYDEIMRIVNDQVKSLGFEVKFISYKAIADQKNGFFPPDCIICDGKFGFEFSMADSMDVEAYVIEGQQSIHKTLENFNLLWKIAVSW